VRQIIYTPGSLPRTDSFTYVCSDGRGGTAQAQVLIRRKAAGESSGRLRDSEHNGAGSIALSMNALGSFRARVSILGTHKTFRGKLGMEDSYSVTIPLKDGRYALLRFELDSLGEHALVGTVENEGNVCSFTAR
jgi:hypothetical protein